LFPFPKPNHNKKTKRKKVFQAAKKAHFSLSALANNSGQAIDLGHADHRNHNGLQDGEPGHTLVHGLALVARHSLELLLVILLFADVPNLVVELAHFHLCVV